MISIIGNKSSTARTSISNRLVDEQIFEFSIGLWNGRRSSEVDIEAEKLVFFRKSHDVVSTKFSSSSL